MKNKYIPDTFNINKIKDNFVDEEEFLRAQVFYKRGFEEFINKCVDFKKIDDNIKSIGDVPKLHIDDFYHNNSVLNSVYFCFRNNVHVENLQRDEIDRILNNQCDLEFYSNTISRVFFEEGDEVFIGTAIPKNSVAAKSLFFEFDYDIFKVKSYELTKKIYKVRDECYKTIEENLSKYIKVPISFIMNDGVINDDMYDEEVLSKIK